jgi:hypothetical protein
MIVLHHEKGEMKIRFEFSRVCFAAAMVSLVGACGGPAETPAPSAPSAPEPVAEEAAPELPPQKIDIASVRARAKTAMFVPAPSEFQAALKASGVDSQLSSLITVDARSTDGKAKAVVALVAGVRVTNVLLAVPTVEKAVAVEHLKSARTALGALELSESLMSDLDKALADFESGQLAAVEVSAMMDVYAGKIQSDLKDSAGEQIATLVKAGGWVQGANLIAKTLGEQEQIGDAAALLRQPSLLMFFLDFIKDTPDAKSGDKAVLAVIDQMEQMMAVAQKDVLTAGDVGKIAAHTDEILAQF